jgi:hypothetical protein
MDFLRRSIMLLCAIYSVALPPQTFAAIVQKDLPAGSKVFLTLDEAVSSKRKESDVGQIVRCRVWRDVDAGGAPFIKGGTPAMCKVDKIKRSNMGGAEGKISIAGLETTSVDGQTVMLSGGYNKEGSGRKAVVWTVGLLLLWPVLFVPGGAAELPPGTVFDTYTASTLRITADVSTPTRAVNIAGLMGGYSAEFLLDEFVSSPKPEAFKFRIAKDGDWPSKFVIDSVNDKSIEPLSLKFDQPISAEGMTTAVGEVAVKPLAKNFQKGINRLQIAYGEGAQRVSTEVIIEIQM